MTKRSDMTTRRGTLKLFGASAALATPGLALAADATMAERAGPSPFFNLPDVPLAWPLYHSAAHRDSMPEVGASVYLERDVVHPSGDRGIAVFAKSGEALGYVTGGHFAAIDWAMKRAGRVDAKLVAVDEPVVRGRRIPGWGAFRISVAAHLEQRVA